MAWKGKRGPTWANRGSRCKWEGEPSLRWIDWWIELYKSTTWYFRIRIHVDLSLLVDYPPELAVSEGLLHEMWPKHGGSVHGLCHKPLTGPSHWQLWAPAATTSKNLDLEVLHAVDLFLPQATISFANFFGHNSILHPSMSPSTFAKGWC